MGFLEEKAKEVAYEAHKGQKRMYSNNPYIEHPRMVASMVSDDLVESDVLKAIAWLHDVVEDTTVSMDELHEIGFPAPVLMAVFALSRRDNETYADFIKRSCDNKLARIIKRYDLMHNMSDLKDGQKLARYQLAIAYIELYEEFDDYLVAADIRGESI